MQSKAAEIHFLLFRPVEKYAKTTLENPRRRFKLYNPLVQHGENAAHAAGTDTYKPANAQARLLSFSPDNPPIV